MPAAISSYPSVSKGAVRRVGGVVRVIPMYNICVAEFKSSNQTRRQIKVHYAALS